ncbi:MAG: efflux RND transporter permease subunit [Desulfobacterales bacterium]
MTSLAFFFRSSALAIAAGAGAGAMKAIGTAVAGGMVSATFIDLFFIPLFFVLIYRLFKGKQNEPHMQIHAVPSEGEIMTGKLSVILAVLIFVSGCSFVPLYERPAAPIGQWLGRLYGENKGLANALWG